MQSYIADALVLISHAFMTLSNSSSKVYDAICQAAKLASLVVNAICISLISSTKHKKMTEHSVANSNASSCTFVYNANTASVLMTYCAVSAMLTQPCCLHSEYMHIMNKKHVTPPRDCKSPAIAHTTYASMLL